MNSQIRKTDVVWEHEALGPGLQFEVEQFLYREAQLLDDRQLHDWLKLMADDLSYQIPVRNTRMSRDMDKEVAPEGGAFLMDESKKSLLFRLAKRDSGRSWSENPASRTRHLISNVRVQLGDRSDELAVRSAFIVYRNRLETTVEIFAGERHDVLRRAASETGFQIARRYVLLDQSTLLAANLSIFF